MKINELYLKFCESNLVSTDTRSIMHGTMFFALKGDNFNGNKFAKQALESGASYAVIDEKEYCINDKYTLVNNVLETLQALSAYHRAQFTIPVVAITGSNGKTTTKELMYALLSTKFNTLATKGNFNNHIGVPLTLLSITNETEIAIVEMGANHIGEIASYCEWVKPTLGLITNIGKAHLEGFGSFENIIKAKTELYKELNDNKKIIFYNEQDELLSSLVEKYIYKMNYGTNGEVDSLVETIRFFPTVEVLFEETTMQSNLFGEYNASNIAAAIAIASYFDVSTEYMKLALENYIPKNNRSEIVQKEDNIIILDAYNANPTSVRATLDSFSKLAVQNKVVMIGDMFELGKNSKNLHQEIVDFTEQLSFKKIVFVGLEFAKCKAKNAIFFNETLEAKKWFQKMKFKHFTFLIKGSRGMKMEIIINE